MAENLMNTSPNFGGATMNIEEILIFFYRLIYNIKIYLYKYIFRMSYNYSPIYGAGMPYSKVSRPMDRRRQIDTHEMLKKELYAQAGVRDVDYAGQIPVGMSGDSGERSRIDQMAIAAQMQQMSIGPKMPDLVPLSEATQDPNISNGLFKGGIVDRFFCLDSSAKDLASNNGDGVLVFSIMNLNQQKPLDHIIEMELDNFFVPEISTSVFFPAYFFFRTLYVTIAEMKAQAVFAQRTNFYHFELGLQPSGISSYTQNRGPSNTFIFVKPFRNLSQATVEFTAPPNFKKVQFAEDTYTFNAVPASAPARIVTTVPHGLTIATLVSIFISGFASNVGDIDLRVNSLNGLLVTVIDATTLEMYPSANIGFDFTNVLTAVPGTLLIGFRRIAFTIRFRCISDEETNRIIPV